MEAVADEERGENVPSFKASRERKGQVLIGISVGALHIA